jgi:capping protein alpha
MMVDFMIHVLKRVLSMFILLQLQILFYIKIKFRFDHLNREASEFEEYQTDEQAESWRLALEKELTDYIKERFPSGACTVTGVSDGDTDTIKLTAFIESHKFEPKNFWNGRWRSRWSLTFNKEQTECELTGSVKSQVIKRRHNLIK